MIEKEKRDVILTTLGRGGMFIITHEWKMMTRQFLRRPSHLSCRSDSNFLECHLRCLNLHLCYALLGSGYKSRKNVSIHLFSAASKSEGNLTGVFWGKPYPRERKKDKAKAGEPINDYQDLVGDFS